jgi:hypothetical protein
MQAEKVDRGREIFKGGISLFSTLSCKRPNYTGFIKGILKMKK